MGAFIFKKIKNVITVFIDGFIKKPSINFINFLNNYAATCEDMLCFSATPLKKFHKYFAVDNADFSAFSCSSRDKPSSNFSHACL